LFTVSLFLFDYGDLMARMGTVEGLFLSTFNPKKKCNDKGKDKHGDRRKDCGDCFEQWPHKKQSVVHIE
jgi:hypothetical protein